MSLRFLFAAATALALGGVLVAILGSNLSPIRGEVSREELDAGVAAAMAGEP